MRHKRLALASFITVLGSANAASPPCYAPGGRQLPNYGVCDPRLAASVCCGSGDICLSNGLCTNPSAEFYRGGCSDKQYQSGLCPSYCIEVPLTAFVSVCDSGSAGDISLCCNNGRKPGTCCQNGTEVFTLAAPFSSVLAGPASATSSATVGTSITATISGTRTFVLPKTVTPGQIHTTSTQQVSTQSAPTTSAPTAAPAANGHHGLNVGAIVGAVVGGILLLISLIALSCLLRRKRKKRPTIRVIKNTQHELPSDDPTLRANSMLFPAELHPQVSKSSLVPAELEFKGSKASSSPAELSTSGQSTGPFELPGKEIDAAELPSSTPEREEKALPRASSHYSRDAGWEGLAAADEVKATGGVIKRPRIRGRPDSLSSGPWHDTFEKGGFF